MTSRMVRPRSWKSLLVFALTLLSLCFGGIAVADSPGDAQVLSPELSPQQKADYKTYLNAKLLAEKTDAAALMARHALSFGRLSYKPGEAVGLDVVQGTSHALNEHELKVLEAQGLVISKRQSFPTFTYGYISLYSQDMPLFVSADSVLHAMHRSYDDILKAAEGKFLNPALIELLASMHSRLAEPKALVGADPKMRAELDLYLCVATALLSGKTPTPVAGADEHRINALVELALKAEGMEEVEFFGAPRKMDFSQFKPRGHYQGDEALERYFRAMMWFGRVDLRLLETQHDQTRKVNRHQVAGAIAIAKLMDSEALDRWHRIDDVIQGFVGESDNMTPVEVTSLIKDLGISSLEDLSKLSDDDIKKTLLAGGYGEQLIASHIVHSGGQIDGNPMPLSLNFLLFGQRYTLDSHVFSQVVYDRVDRGPKMRMMPDPLDIAFAALGNDFALKLLGKELKDYGYAPELHVMRSVTDLHPEAFWEGSLYGLWLKSLRALSPEAKELADHKAAGLPQIATTEAWSRRTLNTQMASWAELRHDTILYNKQSFASVPGCEFPDAYVDPYPEFFAGLEAFAHKGQAVSGNLFGLGDDVLAKRIDDYFADLGAASKMLRGMAQNQRDGIPHTADQLVFINNAVQFKTQNVVCAEITVGANGWYSKLFFENMDNIETDTTIADVHTQPADEAGNPVGRVLHVGTGLPRLMVVTVDTCHGPRTYTGLVSSYHEKVTENFKRLNDQEWLQMLNSNTPPQDVEWLENLL